MTSVYITVIWSFILNWSNRVSFQLVNCSSARLHVQPLIAKMLLQCFIAPSSRQTPCVCVSWYPHRERRPVCVFRDTHIEIDALCAYFVAPSSRYMRCVCSEYFNMWTSEYLNSPFGLDIYGTCSMINKYQNSFSVWLFKVLF
jgi:hypothetical protein